MTDDQRPDWLRIAGFSLALVVLSGAFGGVVGSVVSRRTGLEAVTVAEIAFTVSPKAFALYGAVTVGTFLLTGLGVAVALPRFDEGAA
ncbi:hypothetical protein [Halomontanus rarus]|uniref:hypothetical protein n=1 Tax=Halomontanus rarus TaxID=3034020 RepID=UPI001A999A74